jgi:hypothetical protein
MIVNPFLRKQERKTGSNYMMDISIPIIRFLEMMLNYHLFPREDHQLLHSLNMIKHSNLVELRKRKPYNFKIILGSSQNIKKTH